jgi:hypothetical protein
MIGSAPANLLAQAGSTGLTDQQTDILFWCGVLILVILVFVGLAVLIRRRFVSDVPEADVIGMGFSLADLRAMHERGELSDEEFDYAKRKLIARTRQAVSDEEADQRPDPWSVADKSEPIPTDPDKNPDAEGDSGGDEENEPKA